MAPPPRQRRLFRDRSCNVTVLFSGALTMLLAGAALGIDTATLFLEKRRLQGVADAAALSAAGNPATADATARSVVGANSSYSATLTGATPGQYTAEQSIGPEQRFQPTETDSNAVKVSVESHLPTFFARAFSSQKSTSITAQATAARIDLAAFSIGSRLAGVQGGLPNALLSGLAGTQLNLSAMDYNALVSGNVEILQFSDALRTQAGVGVATFGEALATSVTLPQVVQALAASADSASSATVLQAMAARLPATKIRLSDLIDLGPLKDSVHVDPNRPVTVDAFSVVRAILEMGGTRQVASSLDLGVPGIASSRLLIAIGQRPANSPWLAVNAAHKIVVRTAQTRVLIDSRLSALAPLGLGSIRLPIFVELAQAQAELSKVSCSAGRAMPTAALDVTPSAGEIAIADFDETAFPDFGRAVALKPAMIITTPLATVSAFSDTKLGGVSAQTVWFTPNDIVAHTVKSVSTGDVAQGVASSLLSHTDLRASIVGFGINASLLTAAVGTILGQAATPLDSVVDQVTALAGVRVGQADVWINGVRCGTPILVG
ncbi:pilus assembly protein TadG-related protein [Sphingomonas sp. PWP1-2]|uniref:pilus assembly protein TadG-related protein n=1 Tax=Sphingomonas sp. PWP1-2 TaxID=2804558 RepID=UPI003CED6BFB